jgi:hypothetical protein
MPILPGCIGITLQGQARGLLVYSAYISYRDEGYAKCIAFHRLKPIFTRIFEGTGLGIKLVNLSTIFKQNPPSTTN